MSGSRPPAEPALPVETGFLAPAPTGRPTSHCYRCGKEIPPGESLCEVDNPGHVQSPSATQVHATILVGVVLGVALLLVLLRFAVDQSGPFGTAIAGHIVLADGGVQVAINVTNTGDSEGIASCRITRDGTPRPDDLAFRTDRVAAGATITITRTVPAPVGPGALVPERMTVICA
jgi:predicted nucleic acid-binding Zn ribbon protein